MELLRERHPDDPAADLELSAVLLRQVAAGERGAVARVFGPGPTMAFGRLDALRPGFAAAQEAARAHGYVPLVRLGGGHAAAYDAGSLIVEVTTPEPSIAAGIADRFRALTLLLVRALRAVGVPASPGALEGEYCPGQWSIHAGGVKVAGTAQRSVRGASLVTAAVLVQGGDRLRAALVDVYAALELDWDPRTAGAAEDLAPGVDVAAVAAAAVAELEAERGPLRPAG